MLFLSVRGFSDYAGPKQPLAICAAAVLPSSYSEWSRRPDLRAFRSSIAPPTDASVYASRNISRCPLQDSRSGWIRYFLSCKALASPTTCRFIPALSGLPVNRTQFARAKREIRSLCGRLRLRTDAERDGRQVFANSNDLHVANVAGKLFVEIS